MRRGVDADTAPHYTFKSSRPDKKGANKEEEPQKPKFRGFLGGKHFITKDGFQGLEIDSLWVQNMFSALDHDDAELARVSLRSSLANLKDTVCGGERGAPLSIGGFGFFAASQFEAQAELLQSTERAVSEGEHFLSDEQWREMDAHLLAAASFSRAAFDHVVRGDTFGVLAVKKNAFRCAQLLLENGLDPLVENEEGRDLFHACKSQYQVLSLRARALNERHELFIAQSPQIRSEWTAIHAEGHALRSAWAKFVDFLEGFKDALRERLQEIESDIVYRRRCELLKIPFPDRKAWNVDQKEKCTQHIKDCDDLKNYVKRRLNNCEERIKDFETRTARFLDARYSSQSEMNNNNNENNSEKKESNALEEASLSSAATSLSLAERLQKQRDSMRAMRKADSEKVPQVLGTLVNTADTVVFYK